MAKISKACFGFIQNTVRLNSAMEVWLLSLS